LIKIKKIFYSNIKPKMPTSEQEFIIIDDEEEEFIIVDKTNICEPFWGKVVNKN